MKVPVSWLKDFVDINISIEELARLLTVSGLEVEVSADAAALAGPGDRPGRHDLRMGSNSTTSWKSPRPG